MFGPEVDPRPVVSIKTRKRYAALRLRTDTLNDGPGAEEKKYNGFFPFCFGTYTKTFHPLYRTPLSVWGAHGKGKKPFAYCLPGPKSLVVPDRQNNSITHQEVLTNIPNILLMLDNARHEGTAPLKGDTTEVGLQPVRQTGRPSQTTAVGHHGTGRPKRPTGALDGIPNDFGTLQHVSKNFEELQSPYYQYSLKLEVTTCRAEVKLPRVQSLLLSNRQRLRDEESVF
ncbi:hypothetical protein B0H14DRAFT_2601566 [Mycena olivaceomarginata]|nr:hypothetical protein B0H14DRAFT_2601566 [Mycena olivaceomarginata]